MELRRRGASPLGRAPRPRVLDAVELARCGAQALLQPRGARQGRGGPRREAERRDGVDARGGERGGRVRLRGRGPALRTGLPRKGEAAPNVRRWARSGEGSDDGVRERGGGEDAVVSA